MPAGAAGPGVVPGPPPAGIRPACRLLGPGAAGGGREDNEEPSQLRTRATMPFAALPAGIVRSPLSAAPAGGLPSISIFTTCSTADLVGSSATGELGGRCSPLHGARQGIPRPTTSVPFAPEGELASLMSP